MNTAGVPVDPSLIVGDGYELESGCHAVSKLLKKKAEFTAVIASSDFSAFGVIQELRRNNRNVPTDVSVVGCGNLDFSAMVSPSLSTIDQNPAKIGQEAIAALRKQIEGKGATLNQIFIAPELIVRESTSEPKF